MNNAALDESPAPALGWRAPQVVLGVELLTRLLGISRSCARRYIAGYRATLDTTAAQLRFLAFVVRDIAGAINDIGDRQWFDRPRKVLDGDTPAQTLGDGWSQVNHGSRRIRDFARETVWSPAT